MKTLFICANRCRQLHVNEEYDEIMYVDDVPTIQNIQNWALRIKDAIRRLWAQQTGEDRLVKISMDAANPYRAATINIQVIIKGEESILTEFEGNRGEVMTPQTIHQE
jgi:hypothetical protein